MTESNYEWKKICTCFESDSTKITLMHRSDQRKWNLYWQISEQWKGNIESLRKKASKMYKWINRVREALTIFTWLPIIAGLSILQFNLLPLSMALFLVAPLSIFLKFVLNRARFVFEAGADISIDVSVTASAEVIRGGKDE